jgi:catechol 2,3-dioxygenase-like lactoylglutathione lyase family enzyme
MAKVIGPDFISLQVKDLEASKRFYTEHLGLSLADPRLLFSRCVVILRKDG